MKIPNPLSKSAAFFHLSGISYRILLLVGLILVITGSLNLYLAIALGKKNELLERERTFDQSAQMVSHFMDLQRRLIEDRLLDLSLHPGLLKALKESDALTAESLLLSARRQDTSGFLELLFISRPQNSRWVDVSMDLFQEARDAAIQETSAFSHREWVMVTLKEAEKTYHYLIYTLHLLDPVTGRVAAFLRGGVRLTENPVLIHEWRRNAGLQGLALVWNDNILLTAREDALPWSPLTQNDPALHYARRPLEGSSTGLSIILAISSRSSQTGNTARILFTFGGSMALSLLLLLFLLLRQVAAPLNLLSRQVQTLAHQKDGWLEIPGGQGYDELNTLVEAFNALVREIRKNEARFRLIFDHGYFQAGLVSPYGVVELVNQRALDAMGMKAEDVTGKFLVETPWWQRVEDRERLLMALRFAFSGIEDRFEAHQKMANGQNLTVLVTATPMEIGGKRQILVSGVDITDRKKAELALAEERSRLAQLNLSLEMRVEERTRDLHAALENLKRTQDKLLRSEKLSALGALVAGIAHELNTPIGNAVTVSSTLMDAQSHFTRKMEKGLTRADLDNFLETVEEAGTLLNRNLDKAVDLVSSFKQVAVDQSSYQRRTFDLKEVVEEIRLTMAPSIRRTPHSLSIDIPSGIAMDSYPGPLGQILMNLISNALVHAFDPGEAGLITIRGRKEENGILLQVKDNGCGIPEENRNRIFDPFFTTRLGQGGSGLGLHIVFNLVQDLLGGQILLHERMEKGSCFDIRLPLKAPS